MALTFKLAPRTPLSFKIGTKIPARLLGGDGVDVSYANGAYTISVDLSEVDPLTLGISAFSETLLDDTSASAWRTTLGLGTMAVQSANAVAITGGNITGLTTLGVNSTAPIGQFDVVGSGSSAWVYIRNNVAGSNPSASSSQGFLFGTNLSNSLGEASLLYDTRGGSAPSLNFGRWNGTTVTTDTKLLAGNFYARGFQGVADLNLFGTSANPQAAVTAAIAAGYSAIFLPAGWTWVPTSNLIPADLTVYGENWATSVISPSNAVTEYIGLGARSRLFNVGLKGRFQTESTTPLGTEKVAPVWAAFNNTNTNLTTFGNHPGTPIIIEVGAAVTFNGVTSTDNQGMVIDNYSTGDGIFQNTLGSGNNQLIWLSGNGDRGIRIQSGMASTTANQHTALHIDDYTDGSQEDQKSILINAAGDPRAALAIYSTEGAATKTRPFIDLQTYKHASGQLIRILHGSSTFSGNVQTVSMNFDTLGSFTGFFFDYLNAGVSVARMTAGGVIQNATWQGVKVGLAYGGTNADLSATGGASQVLKQSSAGAVITVGTLAASDLSGLGTGVATALGINVGSAGAPVTFNGALGTPSSGVATNLTGTASGLTAGTVTTNANLTGEVTSVGNATTVAAAGRLQTKTASFTRDLTAASGAVAYTGIGFRPTSIMIISCVPGSAAVGQGFADSAAGMVMWNNTTDNSDLFSSNAVAVVNYTDIAGANAQLAVLTSYDADGFTLTWTKTGTPTGTLALRVLCSR